MFVFKDILGAHSIIDIIANDTQKIDIIFFLDFNIIFLQIKLFHLYYI